MVLRTDTKTLVLAALAPEPLHGYALVKRLQRDLDAHHRIGAGQVYVALRGLEAEGLVTVGREADGAERRTYQITPDGRSALHWQATVWHDCAEAVARVLPPQGAIAFA